MRALALFLLLSLSSSVNAHGNDQAALAEENNNNNNKKNVGGSGSSSSSSDSDSYQSYYSKGDLMPVSCLNRTLDTGEHITDDHGNLQYIPFPTCAETNAPLAFPFATPQTQTCTIPELPDELYHLFEFFVHSDVPLTCRVPTYPLLSRNNNNHKTIGSEEDRAFQGNGGTWTPLTIALQGTLQLSHLHMHTNVNVIFHTTTASRTGGGVDDDKKTHKKNKNKKQQAQAQAQPLLLASTAYSLPYTGPLSSISSSSSSSSSDPQSQPQPQPAAPREGTKVVRNEPFTLTFNVGWIDGAFVPGMAIPASLSSSYLAGSGSGVGVVKHTVGFSLLSFFACAASAGLGAMGMLVYERRNKRSIYSNGILGGNIGGALTGFGNNGAVSSSSAAGFFASLHGGGGGGGGGGTTNGNGSIGNGGVGYSARTSGYGGYGGYSSSTTSSVAGGGKRD